MTEPDSEGRVKIMTLHLPLPISVLALVGQHLTYLYETAVMKPVAPIDGEGNTQTVEIWAGGLAEYAGMDVLARSWARMGERAAGIISEEDAIHEDDL